MKHLFVLIVIVMTANVHAGGVGNGGDHIRATYLKLGASVIDFLKGTKEGERVVIDNNLNIESLSQTLDITKVSVTERILIDNSGSKVDAIGVPGLVTLSKNEWAEHFEKDRDVAYLVFHEMLRSAGINDDNYMVSKSLNPFPVSLRTPTRISSIKNMNPMDDLAQVLLISAAQVGGNGCHIGAGSNTYFDFDSARGIIDLSFKNYRTQVGAPSTLDRKSCQLAIPFQLKKNQRLVLTQLDALFTYDLSKNASVTINTELFLAGGQGPKLNKSISATKKPLTGRSLVRGSQTVMSKCGESGILRFNTSLLNRSTPSTTSTQSEVERITVYMKAEECL